MTGLNRYRIEISPPKQSANDLRLRLDRFGRRYRRAMAVAGGVCITDNAMGHLAFQAHELIAALGLPDAGRVMVHLNSFHSRAELDDILTACDELGVSEILVISGDGAVRLPKLEPHDIGGTTAAVTSVEMVAHIKRHHGSRFRLGVAFNPYEPADHEWAKLERKRAAGADFVVTQPIVAPHPAIDRLLMESGLPVIIEAWMSPRLDLLSDCIGYPLGDPQGVFDPVQALAALRRIYSSCDVYLALFSIRDQLDALRALEAAA